MTDRWWLRPLRAVVVGISAGLAFTWLISGMPFPESMWALMLLVLGILAFCVWQLIDLRRLQREHEERVAEWKRMAGADWPE